MAPQITDNNTCMDFRGEIAFIMKMISSYKIPMENLYSKCIVPLVHKLLNVHMLGKMFKHVYVLSFGDKHLNT